VNVRELIAQRVNGVRVNVALILGAENRIIGRIEDLHP
jgi:hypothetical protein